MKTLAICIVILALASAGGSNDHCKLKKHDSCERCDEGYWLHTDNKCYECKYRVDHCTDCSKYGDVCFACEKGFYQINEKLCGICMNGINMCEICDPKGMHCYKCIHPWEERDGKCYYSLSSNKWYDVAKSEWSEKLP